LNAIAGVMCQMPQGVFYVFPNDKSFAYQNRRRETALS
jgi:aspartate/methionine/tyrosine aminotransferase